MLDFSFKYLFLSLVTLILALPLYYKMVPPNYLVGFKEQRILGNRTAWYDINRFFGLQIMKGSLLLAILSLITPLITFTLILNRESTIVGILILISVFAVCTTKKHAETYLSGHG